MLLLVLILTAPGATAVSLPLVVGSWYGEAQPDDPNVFWFARFAPDGKFEAKFRTCHGKRAEDEDDVGRWSYRSGDLEVTSTLVNGAPTFLVEHYRTLSYDGRKHVYRHARTGFVFSAVRVRPDFELPSCNLSS